MRRLNGNLAEAKALAHFVSFGYECFLPFSGVSPIDLIVYGNGALFRVSVKYTSSQANSGNWNVTLKTVSRRAHNSVNVSNFSNSDCDIVAVYVGPLDKVVLLDSSKITAVAAIVIKDSEDEREWKV